MDASAAMPTLDERQLRVDLAAVFRIAARLDWPEAVANYFSVATGADGRYFLMNPRWRHFSSIRASELLSLAYSTGRPLSILADEIAEKTALSWQDGGAFASAHFAQMKRLLDAEQSCYAD
jgi:ribulose-5-phosphate 4-epimerase/fuculose-1-phosphate aldolase